MLEEYNKYKNVVSHLGAVTEPGRVIDVWILHCSDGAGINSHATALYPSEKSLKAAMSKSGYLSGYKGKAIGSTDGYWSVYCPVLNEDPEIIKRNALAKLTPDEIKVLGL